MPKAVMRSELRPPHPSQAHLATHTRSRWHPSAFGKPSVVQHHHMPRRCLRKDGGRSGAHVPRGPSTRVLGKAAPLRVVHHPRSQEGPWGSVSEGLTKKRCWTVGLAQSRGSRQDKRCWHVLSLTGRASQPHLGHCSQCGQGPDWLPRGDSRLPSVLPGTLCGPRRVLPVSRGEGLCGTRREGARGGDTHPAWLRWRQAQLQTTRGSAFRPFSESTSHKRTTE